MNIKFLNELRWKGKAHIMTTDRGKSHNELGKKIIIIANIIQENMQLLEIWTSSDKKKEPRTYCSRWEKERMWTDGSLSTLLYSSKDISISMVNLYHHREQKKGSIQSKKLAQNLLKNFMFVRSTSPTMVSKMWKLTFVQNLCQVGHTKLIKLNIYESIPCSRQVEHGEQAGQMWGTPHQHW